MSKRQRKNFRYYFRQDYDLDDLPEKECIYQPGKSYGVKRAKKLLKYSDQAKKLSKENFFKQIKTWYDEGLQTKEPMPEQAFGGADKPYPDIYMVGPFPGLVGKPKQHGLTGKEEKLSQLEAREKYKHFAAKYALKPYYYVHYPWPEYIGKWLPDRNDGITYKSSVPYDEIIKTFRAAGKPLKHANENKLERALPPAYSMLRRSAEKMKNALLPKSKKQRKEKKQLSGFGDYGIIGDNNKILLLALILAFIFGPVVGSTLFKETGVLPE